MTTKLLERARNGDVTIIPLMSQWKHRRAMIKKHVLLNELWLALFYGKSRCYDDVRKVTDQIKQFPVEQDVKVQRIVSRLKYERHQRVLAYFK